MIASEYDKIEPTFKRIMDDYESKCVENDVNFYFCLGNLIYYFQIYLNERNKLKLNDKYKIKSILNTKLIFDVNDNEFIKGTEFESIKQKLFSFLDSTKDPYFFILSPIYRYGQGVAYKNIPYLKEKMSGIQNIDIATDYALYKLSLNKWL